MKEMRMPGKSTAMHDTHVTAAASADAIPGKSTLAQALPVVELAPEHVAPFKNQRVHDGSKYEYEVTEDGAFSIVRAPEGSKAPVGTLITRVKHPEAWRKLATRLLASPPKAATTAPAVTPAPLPAKDASAKVEDLLSDFTEGEKQFHKKLATIPGSTLEIANTRVKLGDEGTTYSRPNTSASQMASGDKNATTFFCSALQVWTLAAAGYNVDTPILGADGQPYTYTLVTPNTDPKTKDKEPKKRVTKTVTMQKLIDGYPEVVEAMSIAEANNMTNGGNIDIDGTKIEGHAKGWSEDGPNHAVRGVARAFELARIGTEVPAGEQKPGDFAQSRYIAAGATHHDGHGHAWQVWSVNAKGRALFGQAGSPKPIGDKQLEGWQDNVEFTIDESTSPACVGKHEVLAERRLEANEPQVMNENLARKKGEEVKGDGGVQITAPKGNDKDKKDWHVFYGRLGTSPWSGWHPHEADAPATADPDVDGKHA